jgi:hypothetical protein
MTLIVQSLTRMLTADEVAAVRRCDPAWDVTLDIGNRPAKCKACRQQIVAGARRMHFAKTLIGSRHPLQGFIHRSCPEGMTP